MYAYALYGPNDFEDYSLGRAALPFRPMGSLGILWDKQLDYDSPSAFLPRMERTIR